MRTLSEYVKLYQDYISVKVIHKDILELVIKKAMEDAIRECAEQVPVCHVVEGQCGFNKKLILDLINEVK